MTNEQRKILRIVHRYKFLGKILQKSKIENYAMLQDALENKYLIFSDYEMADNTGVKLDNYAKQELQTFRREQLRFWIPVFISIVALIKSFMPEIISGMKLIMQLLK